MILVIAYGDVVSPNGYRTRVLEHVVRTARHRSLELFVVQDTGVSTREAEELCRTMSQLGVNCTLFYRSPGRFATFFGLLGAIIQVLRLARQRRPEAIHAHNPHAALLGLLVKAATGTPLVLDLHGLVAEEYRLLRQISQFHPSYLVRLLLERLVCRGADITVFVSDAMRRHILARHGGRGGCIIPTCTDVTLFRPDMDARDKVRQALGIVGRLVLVHSGMVGGWQPLDPIVRVFRVMKALVPEAFLLILTPTPGVAGELLRAKISEQDFAVIRVPHEQVPTYLNAADVGLLLRPSSVVNEVALPTKFGEYLACGLPVMVSPGLGQLASWVRAYGLGWVIDPWAPERELVATLSEIRPALTQSLKDMRVRCVEFARVTLNWETYHEQYLSVYQQVVGRG